MIGDVLAIAGPIAVGLVVLGLVFFGLYRWGTMPIYGERKK